MNGKTPPQAASGTDGIENTRRQDLELVSEDSQRSTQFKQEIAVPCEEINGLLQQRFGLSAFRPHQKKVCETIINGYSALLVMPTGAGKSLCYQLPGFARGGTTLVICPLIALMEDQVDKLQKLGFDADRIHSGRQTIDSREVCRRYLTGDLDYLFIAPERLGYSGFLELLSRKTPSLIAIDEAHCISQWGHDFRPAYRLLKDRLSGFQNTPKIALTATATRQVQLDIIEQLGLENIKEFIQGFRRKNIAIYVKELSKSQRADNCLKILSKKGSLPAIVYASTRKETETIAGFLSPHFATMAYHAGFSTEDRNKVQTLFISSKIEVVVATIAFGMGIDKPDIRTVIHTTLPSSIEGYYQEIGRAGRDGKYSEAYLFYSYSDKKTYEHFINKNYPPIEDLKNIIASVPKEGVLLDVLITRNFDLKEKIIENLEKIRAHNGIIVTDENLVLRRNTDWEQSYLSQYRHKIAQTDDVLSFAASHNCRMLHLISYFNDKSDTKTKCGHCDSCKIRSVTLQDIEGNAQNRTQIIKILEILNPCISMATGRLYKEISSETDIGRDDYRQITEKMAATGLLLLKNENFMKSGKKISYIKAYITENGRDWLKMGNSHGSNASLQKSIKTSSQSQNNITFSKGQLVQHSVYGQGMVQEIDTMYENTKLIVAFDVGLRKVGAGQLRI